MTIIQMICQYLFDCFATISIQIKKLFRYDVGQGYEVLDSATSQSPASASIRGEEVYHPILKNKEENSGSRNVNGPIIEIDEMSKTPKKSNSEEYQSCSYSYEKNKYDETRDTSNTDIAKQFKENKLKFEKNQKETIISSTSELSSNIDLESKYAESKDVSKINLFKMEYGSKNKKNDSSSDSSKTVDSTVVPKSITQVMAKTPKMIDHKSETVDQAQPNIKKFEEINTSNLEHGLIPEKKRPACSINKSASVKISKLAGNLGKINFLPPSAGGKPPSLQSRPISYSGPPKEECSEQGSVSGVTNILKCRNQSMNKKRRPPTKEFIRNISGYQDPIDKFDDIKKDSQNSFSAVSSDKIVKEDTSEIFDGSSEIENGEKKNILIDFETIKDLEKSKEEVTEIANDLEKSYQIEIEQIEANKTENILNDEKKDIYAEEIVVENTQVFDKSAEFGNIGGVKESKETEKLEESKIFLKNMTEEITNNKLENNELFEIFSEENKSDNITPNPSISSSLQNLNENSLYTENNFVENSEKGEINESLTDTHKTELNESTATQNTIVSEEFNDEINTSSRMDQSDLMNSSRKNIIDESEQSEMIFESARDLSTIKSGNPYDGSNVNINNQFSTVVGDDFLSALNLSQIAPTNK